MAKKLGVEWTHDERLQIQRRQFATTGLAFREKIVGVSVGRRHRPVRIVEFLRIGPASDPMIFEPGKFPHPGRIEERPKLFLGAIETRVAIKIAINRIARVTALGAPDFAIRFPIADENRRPSRGVTG